MPVSAAAIGLTAEDKQFVQKAIEYIDASLVEKYKHDGHSVIIEIAWIESALGRRNGCNKQVHEHLIKIYENGANYPDGGKPWKVEYHDSPIPRGSLTFIPPKD